MAFTLFNAQTKKRLKRLLHAKSIVVVSQHAVDHYALSLRAQLAVALAVLTVVGLASYSTGRYLEARGTIAEKERSIEVAQAQNQKITGEFALLRQDLIKITQEGDSLSDYAQFVLDQYQDPTTSLNASDNLLGQQSATVDGSRLLERVNYLEGELEREQLKREQFIHIIRRLAKEKIRTLEEAVHMTGMEDEISSIMDKQTSLPFPPAEADEPDTSSGGPYYPWDASLSGDAAEQAAIGEVSQLIELLEAAEYIPFAVPMPSGRLTSGYGRRIDPFKRTLAMHTGIDFAGRIGTKVHSTASGTVIYAGYKGAYGRVVDIDHGNGFLTRYGHLSRVLVRTGQKVSVGEIIGVQGTTGRSTGHHLHYEVHYKGRTVNPKPFVEAGRHVSTAIR